LTGIYRGQAITLNSSTSGSSAVREGAAALIAIAIVLFFVIRIYLDYASATGQTHLHAAGRPEVSGKEWSAVGAQSGSSDYATGRGKNEYTKDRSLDLSVGASPGSRSGNGKQFPGQIVEEREPPAEDRDSSAAVVARVPRAGAPPRPHAVDDPAAKLAAEVDPPLGQGSSTLFHARSPYPGDYDEIQVGDHLAEIENLHLPGGGRSKSLYSYHPRGGPFKTIYAMLAIGSEDPVVTGVVFLFRNGKKRAEVTRQAQEVFGEVTDSPSHRGDQILWRHRAGFTISIDADRYTVEQDLPVSERKTNPR